MAGTYIGKVCAIHPELKGERNKNVRRCSACHRIKKSTWARTNRNRDKVMSMVYSRLRQQGIKESTPKWADRQAIRDIYAKRLPGQVVDHMIPLKGIDRLTGVHVVCGLHVENNLVVVDSSENGGKWAWFDTSG
jgi:hypothetical protein